MPECHKVKTKIGRLAILASNPLVTVPILELLAKLVKRQYYGTVLYICQFVISRRISLDYTSKLDVVETDHVTSAVGKAYDDDGFVTTVCWPACCYCGWLDTCGQQMVAGPCRASAPVITFWHVMNTDIGRRMELVGIQFWSPGEQLAYDTVRYDTAYFCGRSKADEMASFV